MNRDHPSIISAAASKAVADRRPQNPARRKVGIALLSALLLTVLSCGVYFARQSGTSAGVYSNDFNVYYHAATEIREGRDPYQKSLGDWTPYLYPPLLAECLIPLTFFSLPVAAYLWFLLSAASVLAAIWMSASLASESKRRGGADELLTVRSLISIAVFAVVFRFTLDTFNLGQVNNIVAALAVAHVYLYARERKNLSAIALVLAISIKLTPGLLIIYHLAKLRLKFAAVCISLFVSVMALSFLPFEARGVNAFENFANRTLRNEQGYNLADRGNQSLRGAIGRLTGGSDSRDGEERNPVEAGTLGTAILFIIAAIFAARRARSELAGVAPFFCCLVLLSPLSWKAHFVILVLPVAYLMSEAFDSRTSAGVRRVLLSLIACSFALFNLTSPKIVGLAAAEWADAHSLVTLGALLMLGAVIGVSGLKFGKHQTV